MHSREELSDLLRTLLGNDNVYYQPPESVKMKYPAIRYSKDNYYVRHANDSKYLNGKRWELIVISKSPDDPVIDELLKLEYCGFDRRYIADNLYHDVLTLYY